jgi:hypothetical protein
MPAASGFNNNSPDIEDIDLRKGLLDDSDLFQKINEENENSRVRDEVLDTGKLPIKELSVEVAEIMGRYSHETLEPAIQDQLIQLNKKMLQRREQFMLQYPHLPYIPLDISNLVAKIDTETGMASPVFPGGDLNPTIERIDYVKTFPNSNQIGQLNDGTYYPTTHSANRAPEADLEVTMVEWDCVNSGMGNFFELDEINGTIIEGTQYYEGGFQIGKDTTIKATIRNNNPLVSVENVLVNFTVYRTVDGYPMQRNPETYKIKSISAQSVVVEHVFNPKFAANWITVVATVDYSNDPEPSNDLLGYRYMPVMIWSADFEGHGTEWGWQKTVEEEVIENTMSEWTGDIGKSLINNNQWNITDSPAYPNSEDHTQDNAWYHGFDGIPDRYEDSAEHLYLETPWIDMGPITDGQEILGPLQEDWYYIPFVPYYSCMVTGELEWNGSINGSDIIWVNEICDSKESEQWYELLYVWGPAVFSNYPQLLTTIYPGHLWYPLFHGSVSQGQLDFIGYHAPFARLTGDGSGGVKDLGGASNWSHVRFRCDFQGDNEEGVSSSETGAYYDDFITFGSQSYVVPNHVGLIEVTLPTSHSIPILKKGSTASFKTTVKNYGEQKQFDVEVTIKDSQGNTVFNQQKPTVELPTDAETEIDWSWPPDMEGDYELTIVAGDPTIDWTPLDNIAGDFLLHVGPDHDVDILVVDDDNSAGSRDLNTPYWYVNTEPRMLHALNDNSLDYQVYTVQYNETGPTALLMDQYDLIIWMTGLDNEYDSHGWRQDYDANDDAWDITLKEDDVEQLELFLSSPSDQKKLWLISPGFLYDHYGEDASITAPADFAKVYLHIDRCYVELIDNLANPLYGTSDSCMNSAVYPTYDDPPQGFKDISCEVQKKSDDDETFHLFYQNQLLPTFNSLHYPGEDHKTAYFGFNFYLLSQREDRKDCVYRLLRCFGLFGGVKVEPYDNQEKQKGVAPGHETSFRLIVSNPGKTEDTMTLSVIQSITHSDWEAWFQIKGRVTNTVTISGSKIENRVYLYVQAPNMTDPDDYPTAGTLVGFIIEAVSGNTEIVNTTKVHAEVLAAGNITIDCLNPEMTINANETSRFYLRLINETNGIDDVIVRLSFGGSGKNLARFSINGEITTAPEIERTLEPNIRDNDVELVINADAHTLSGYYNITAVVKDTENKLLDSVELIVFVKQFYQVKCITDGEISTGETELTIDPNNLDEDIFIIDGDIDDGILNLSVTKNDQNDKDSVYIKKSFIMNIQNYGNGVDIVLLGYEEGTESKDTSNWGFNIVTVDNEEEISSIQIAPYSESQNPKYGHEQVQFDVYIPKSAESGEYSIEFFIQSSQPEIVNSGENEIENNRVTLSFKIEKPNLRFAPVNNQYNIDNYEFWDMNSNLGFGMDSGLKILRDQLRGIYYQEVEHKDFELLSIEFNVVIDNTGITDATLEPRDIHLAITHKDEFGYLIYDTNLTPEEPKDTITIPPGENGSFTFVWDYVEQDIDTEVDYTFKITIDPWDIIYEDDEDDNSNEVTLTIKHLDDPPPPPDDLTTFTIFIAIALLGGIIFIGILIIKKMNKRKD